MKRALRRSLYVRQSVYYFDENAKRIEGPPPGVTGSLAGIRGNLTGIAGNLTGVTGDLSDIIGDLTGVLGNLTGIAGDIHECYLTPEDRARGVFIEELLKDTLGGEA